MRFVLVLLAAIWISSPIFAQNKDIENVISSQIEAFKQDDFAKAFSYASPMIKGMFGTSDRFGMMVRQGYPMVWRPADVTFQEQEMRGPLTYQKVLIRDKDGVFHTLEYEMLPTDSGWQINGVQYIRPPAVAA